MGILQAEIQDDHIFLMENGDGERLDLITRSHINEDPDNTETVIQIPMELVTVERLRRALDIWAESCRAERRHQEKVTR